MRKLRNWLSQDWVIPVVFVASWGILFPLCSKFDQSIVNSLWAVSEESAQWRVFFEIIIAFLAFAYFFVRFLHQVIDGIDKQLNEE